MGQADEHDGRYQLPLYVTERQIIERMGVGVSAGRKAIQKMRQHPRFPPKDIGGKRYWPSVRDFLDLWNQRVVPPPVIAPPQEQYLGRAGANLDKAKKRIGFDTRDYRTAFEKAHANAPKRGRAADQYWEAYRISPLNKRNYHKPGWVFIVAPDGGNWIEPAKPTDPASWQEDFAPEPEPPKTAKRRLLPSRKRKLTPRAPPAAKDGV